jgi:hypothetical protein
VPISIVLDHGHMQLKQTLVSKGIYSSTRRGEKNEQAVKQPRLELQRAMENFLY